ncbi:helix-turn-helix transcriptional regulator [uncultured Roseobacter sp.]|uniref:helix-turn-helix transcriptional regulator n=1 Tax=uncultured Roseobacter sp. TaxID=114847 RepID=UPI0026056479|nr:helix-turn-helix transcriptional regulator [uncultured Roseobacter sp.]
MGRTDYARQRKIDEGIFVLNANNVAALPLIYETATNPGRWRRALDTVAEALEAKAIALLIRQPDSLSRDKQMLSSAYLDFVRSPAGIYYGLCLSKLQNPDWDYLARQPSWRITQDTETGLTAEALDSRADYRMLRRKVGVGRRWGVRFNADRLWFDAASIALPADQAAAPAALAPQLNGLLPHLTKAIELGRTFGLLKARYKAVLAALDHVKIGLAVALPSGELIVRNAELDRILSLQDGLSVDPSGRLAMPSEDLQAEVQAGIQVVGDAAAGKSRKAEFLVAIPRPTRDPSFLLECAPLVDSSAEIASGLQGALISVVDPVSVPEIDMRRFVKLYKLTRAEAGVCELMLLGLTTEVIAEHRGVSPLTVKNQISVIYSKVGVARRSEFIRLVMKLLPPVG